MDLCVTNYSDWASGETDGLSTPLGAVSKLMEVIKDSYKEIVSALCWWPRSDRFEVAWING